MFSSIDENAFKSAPEVDMPGDMMRDDLPTNLDYLDAAYGAAGGINAYSDEDDFEDDFSEGDSTRGPATPTPSTPESSVLTNTRGETIRMLDPRGINIIEDYYETITPVEDEKGPLLDYALVARVRVKDTEVMVHLHDGYDWLATRKAIEDEVRAMRRKLMKIRQLLASGQVPDESVEETHTLLFNSVHIGLPQNVDEMETGELMAAIDEELKSNDEDETATQSSWQSLNRSMGASPSARTPSQLATPKPHRVRGRKLTRSKHSRIDVCLYGLEAEVDKLHPNESEGTSRTLVKVKDIEILDHIKTSTWKKFLTEIKSDSKGNIRETDSYMARVELKMVKPTQNLEQEEARLRMKLLPLRLHVDQDALDFLKAFGSFSAPQGSPPPSTKPKSSSDETYFQHVEVFPVALKLDYKPKRVDYKALREGRTIELMNFFHFDGAEMTLRHIKLSGIQGWATLGERLNDLWTPDVKANQMVDVISGIAPIRSVVNVGSGFADLILLPISQYKKDGRLVRGLQKGAKSFVKTTAMEAVKLGAKLATGTQVILEEAENMLGGTKVGVVAEPLEAGYATAVIASPHMSSKDTLAGSSSEEGSDAETDIRSARSPIPGPSDVAPHIISRYADQPHD
ncbi:autophagy- protein 2, partial [Tulasnella sp. 403]